MVMQTVILPFALHPSRHGKAVSELNFSVQAPQGQFRSVSIAKLQFMKVYEQQHYDYSQYPFTQGWHEWKTYTDAQRVIAATNPTGAQNALSFGHPWTPELATLDELPQWIEIDIFRASKRIDRTAIGTNVQQERQTTETQREFLKEDHNKIQSLLNYSPSILNQWNGGFHAFVSCSMSNLGFADIRDQGNGNVFTIKASMYDFKSMGISTMPPIQLTLIFS